MSIDATPPREVDIIFNRDAFENTPSLILFVFAADDFDTGVVAAALDANWREEDTLPKLILFLLHLEMKALVLVAVRRIRPDCLVDATTKACDVLVKISMLKIHNKEDKGIVPHSEI